MAHEISVPAGSEYVEVKWSGSVDATDVERVRAATEKHFAESNLSRILYDVREVTLEPTTIELYDWTAGAEFFSRPQARLAILGRADQAKNMTFVHHVGINRGKQVEVFTDRIAALEWLAR